MFNWNDKSIKWFSDSANKTTFHKDIAKEIIPYLNNNDTLLSLGSGLGFLERQLSPYIKSMTLVDNNDKAITYLNAHKLDNQQIINISAQEINSSYDYLLLSFFSRMYIDDSYHIYQKMAKKKIFYLINERRCDVNQVFSYFDNKNIKYSYKKMKLEFNQVLQKNEITDFLDQYYSFASITKKQKLLDNLINIDDETVIFKNNKKIILIIIDLGDKEL
ncbi:MAG: hypothetical protein EOL97_07330 [Spirochaetia bacterium]|nr:hypothetical protein [Spirochaetia bacterium]